ncbi:Aldo/keto reductase [Westerdykella ornata]|uniref:Aldo/keto reductase n=1 Tax=Westerdykella ornata TaxID=318751 RepID=A0A6A6JTE9_WESOR|nr:Aldo/keto reductase [Westerdykella ornata]KAF2279535.1 Aldo/keto reductase [Westerdykella ornata]
MAPSTKLDIIFGAMTFGKEGVEQVRTSNLDDCAAILSTFQSHGHHEIDTARAYGNGSSEEYLGQLIDWQSQPPTLATKFYPNIHGYLGFTVTHLTEADMRAAIDASLAALKTPCVDLWYLHGPDRSVPLEETVAIVQKFYREGKFKTWGVSNFMAWEVAAICEMCDAREGWVKPTVYQGVYNVLNRTVEHELLPCLRKYGIAFYAFNPLAGGYLTDRYRRDIKDEEIEPGSRFDQNRIQGKMYRMRYWNDAFFSALERLREVVLPKGLRESEVALRWMMHHSALKREYGDKVIIGASSKAQLERNLEDFEKGELGKEVLSVLDEGWEICRGVAWKYFH